MDGGFQFGSEKAIGQTPPPDRFPIGTRRPRPYEVSMPRSDGTGVPEPHKGVAKAEGIHPNPNPIPMVNPQLIQLTQLTTKHNLERGTQETILWIFDFFELPFSRTFIEKKYNHHFPLRVEFPHH